MTTQPNEALVEECGDALRKCAATFSRPVDVYVEPEAEIRFEAEHGFDAAFDAAQSGRDFNRESWQILARAIIPIVQKASWQPIETAPEGTPRLKGTKSFSWMMLAIPDNDGGFHVVNGMRCEDKFYACLTFYCGGPWDGKQFQAKEVEVKPTYWSPLPEGPSDVI